MIKVEYIDSDDYNITVKLTCPMYLRDELVKYEKFYFGSVSKHVKGFHIPVVMKSDDGAICDYKQMDARIIIENSNKQAFQSYNNLITLGVSPSVAKGVLPQNSMVSVEVTGYILTFKRFMSFKFTGCHSFELSDIKSKLIYCLYSNENIKDLL